MNATTQQRLIGYLRCLLALFTTLPAAADAGVFTGNGQNLRQISSKSIQLVSIDVSIMLGRGPFLFDSTVPGMDRTEYECKFVLRNLTEKAEDVQVGFPIDSQFARSSERDTTEEAEQNWVLEYAFIALDQKNTYHVRFVRRKPGKGPNEYGAIFVWNMNFTPHETKTLRVQYHIPISMGLTSTERDEMAEKSSQTAAFSQELTTIAQLEIAGYITATGSSWARNVEKATFRVYTQLFEKYLDRRGLFEQTSEDLKPEEAAQFKVSFPVQDPWWFREIKPNGWKAIKGGIQWQYQDYKPKDPISIAYYMTQFPKRADEVDAFVDRFVQAIPPEDSVRAELEKLRQVLLATYGKQPQNPDVRSFASAQRWYAPRKDFSMADLKPGQQAVLETLSKRIVAAK
jgi:hypothetical protein